MTVAVDAVVGDQAFVAAGFGPVDRHEIVKEKSVEELNAQTCESCRREWGRDANKRFQKQEKHIRR